MAARSTPLSIPPAQRRVSTTPKPTAPASGWSQTEGAARVHTKTVAEMVARRRQARANAQAADKGKMTKAADLVNVEAANAKEKEPVGV